MMKSNLVVDGVLRSPDDDTCSPDRLVGSSYLRRLREKAEAALALGDGHDFVWLRDVLRGEELTAKEGLDLAHRYN